jgi:hypothetical protein
MLSGLQTDDQRQGDELGLVVRVCAVVVVRLIKVAEYSTAGEFRIPRTDI